MHLEISETTMSCLNVCVCSLLEMMLESSLSDLRDAAGVTPPHHPNLLRLLRLLQDFLFAEGTDNHNLWSEKVSPHPEKHPTRSTTISVKSAFLNWHS